MKKISRFAGIGTALLLASMSASAIVTQWDYTVDSAFTAATYVGSGGNPTTTFPATTLSWGIPVNGSQSSLVVGNNPALGTVTTYLGTTPPQTGIYLGNSTSLTHNNRVIQGGSSSLRTAVLTNTVTLDPLNPNNPALAPQIVPFNISFTETTNAGTCAATSPAGNPCNDIFVLTGGLLNFSFDYDAGDADGLREYFVNIFPTTGGVLSVLEDTACAAALVSNGCIGFTTPEGADTTLAFGFTISTNRLEIPEPGSMALIGLALLGLGATGRRQRKTVSPI